jgi:biopolymer transport protein ExbB
MDSGLSILTGGGPIVWLLAAMSLASLMLIAAKALSLRGTLGKPANRAGALELWQRGDRGGALARLQGASAPPDRLLHRAMEGVLAGNSRAGITADLEWRGQDEIAAASRHIRLLELIAMISPLLGLLGTVLGMILAFQELALADGAANAASLAGGIWQALLTTAAGLLVAIPAAVAASLFSARVDAMAQSIETAIGQLLSMADDPAKG